MVYLYIYMSISTGTWQVAPDRNQQDFHYNHVILKKYDTECTYYMIVFKKKHHILLS